MKTILWSLIVVPMSVVAALAFEPGSSPSLERLAQLESGGAGNFGSRYDGSTRRRELKADPDLYTAGAPIDGHVGFTGGALARHGSRGSVPSVGHHTAASEKKTGLMKKARTLGAGALLGLLLFGGLVGALAGISLLMGAKALLGKFVHRKESK